MTRVIKECNSYHNFEGVLVKRIFQDIYNNSNVKSKEINNFMDYKVTDTSSSTVWSIVFIHN